VKNTAINAWNVSGFMDVSFSWILK